MHRGAADCIDSLCCSAVATRDILAIRQLYLQIAGLHVGDNDVDRGGNRMNLVVLRTCNVLGWKAKEAFLEIARERASLATGLCAETDRAPEAACIYASSDHHCLGRPSSYLSLRVVLS